MRSSLLAIAEELKRLKSQGVKHVPVSEEGLRALRKVLGSPSLSTASATRAQEPAVRHDISDRTHLGAAAAEPASGASHSAERSIPPSESRSAKAPKLKELDVPAVPLARKIILPTGSKAEKLNALREAVAQDSLYLEQRVEGRVPVFASGSLDASVMICGELPGAEEMAEGQPFVGPSGQKLTLIVSAMGLKREDVFLTYLLPWRHKDALATSNELEKNPRPPTDSELLYAVSFLRAQLEIVQPKVLIMLGASAAKAVLGAKAFRIMSDARGKWFDFEGWPVIVTYDPNYLLRQMSQGKAKENQAKRVVWEAMLMAMERVGLPISDKQRGYFLS